MLYLKWFKEAYDVLTDAIFLVSRNGDFVAANSFGAQLFETNIEGLIVSNIKDFVKSPSVKDYMVSCLGKTQQTISRFEITLPSGKSLVCRAYGSRLKNDPLLKLLEQAFEGQNMTYLFLRLVKQDDALAPYKLIKAAKDKIILAKHKDRELENSKNLKEKNEKHEFEEYYKAWLLTKFIEDLKLPLSILQEKIQALGSPASFFEAARVVSNNITESIKLVSMLEDSLQDYVGELPRREEPVELSCLLAPILTHLAEGEKLQHLKFQTSIEQKIFLTVNEKIVQKALKTIFQVFFELHTGTDSINLQARTSFNGKLIITIYDYDNASILESLPQTAQELLDKNYGRRLDKKIDAHMYLAKKILENYAAKLFYDFHPSRGSIVNIIFPKEKIDKAA